MHKWLFVIILGAMIISLPYVSFAQEEDVEYNYGTVVKVDEAKKEITITEYDWESDEDITVTYSIAPDVKLENVNSIKEIKPGTCVDVEYIVQGNGKKIIKSISVYEEEFTE